MLFRRLLGALTATGVAIVGLLLSPATAGQVAAAGPTGGPTPADTQVMLAQVPLAAAADRIQSAGTFAGSGYANIVISVPKHLVTVYWKEPVPAAVDAVVRSLRSASVAIELRPAAYSKTELDQQAAHLMDTRSSLAASGIEVDQVGARNDGSGLDVGVRSAAG